MIIDMLEEISDELEIMSEEEGMRLQTDFHEEVVIYGNLSLI